MAWRGAYDGVEFMIYYDIRIIGKVMPRSV